MKNTFSILALIAGAVALTGCNQGGGGAKAGEYKPVEVARLETAEFKPGGERDLFPFKVGNSWSYDAEISFRPNGAQPQPPVVKVLRFRCTQVVKTAKGIRVNMEVVMDGRVNEVQEWLLTDQGLFQSSVGYPGRPFNPPQPAWRSPMQIGAKFSWKGTGFTPDGQVGPGESTSEVLPKQDVDTGLGQVNAVPVQTRLSWPKGRALSTTWWAPGYGIVRYRQEAITEQGLAVQVMRLKSVSIAK